MVKGFFSIFTNQITHELISGKIYSSLSTDTMGNNQPIFYIYDNATPYTTSIYRNIQYFRMHYYSKFCKGEPANDYYAGAIIYLQLILLISFPSARSLPSIGPPPMQVSTSTLMAFPVCVFSPKPTIPEPNIVDVSADTSHCRPPPFLNYCPNKIVLCQSS